MGQANRVVCGESSFPTNLYECFSCLRQQQPPSVQGPTAAPSTRVDALLCPHEVRCV